MAVLGGGFEPVQLCLKVKLEIFLGFLIDFSANRLSRFYLNHLVKIDESKMNMYRSGRLYRPLLGNANADC